MSADVNASGAAVPLMLTELRLPTIKRLWADVAAQSNREGWPAERLLHTLLGHEMAERETRRLARARVDSQLPPGKSLADFDFAAVPAVPPRQNSCRPDKSKTGGGDEGREWLGTDKHSRTRL